MVYKFQGRAFGKFINFRVGLRTSKWHTPVSCLLKLPPGILQNIFDKSNKEPFASKLVVDPKNKRKPVTINLETKESTAQSKFYNSLVQAGSEGNASGDDDDISDNDTLVQDKEDMPIMNLQSDKPLNKQREMGGTKRNQSQM